MTTFSDTQKAIARRVECEENSLYFTRYFMKWRTGAKMNVGAHHVVMQSTLDRTMLPPSHPDFINRLIVNVPPGYSKTELCVIHYMARGLALNPSARFLHLSYSNDLALLNSNSARQIVKSEPFQKMWQLGIQDDTDSKTLWHTDKAGGVKAGSAGGQVTGFRAGYMDKERFTGSLLIDDPVKPENATSDVIRKGVNNNYNETIASRVAVETNPIIVVMQRIHWDDLSGYLLRGGSGERWHHLNLPAIIDSEADYPAEYTHGIPIEHGLPDGWLWSFKHNEEHESILKSHRRKWAAQYMQKPLKRDEQTALWPDELLQRARELQFAPQDKPQRTLVSIDPATTDTETSDEHGIIVGSKCGAKKYQIEADYTRKGSPMAWAKAAIHAYAVHEADAILIETNQGGDMCESTLRNAGYKGRIIRVTAKKSKALRAEPVVALYELGQVKHCSGLSKLEDEQADFDPVTQKSNGKSPNRVDAAVYVLTELAGLTESTARVRAL